jgi:hypothetical protein
MNIVALSDSEKIGKKKIVDRSVRPNKSTKVSR